MNKTDVNKLVKVFDHLESRWQDEKAYENFEDYRKYMRQFCKEINAKLLSMSSSPFQVVVQTGGKRVSVRIKDGDIETNEEV